MSDTASRNAQIGYSLLFLFGFMDYEDMDFEIFYEMGFQLGDLPDEETVERHAKLTLENIFQPIRADFRSVYNRIVPRLHGGTMEQLELDTIRLIQMINEYNSKGY